MFHGTTIVAVLKDGRCALAGDGQVTLGGNTIMKHHAVKVRRIFQGKVLAGFAGSVADSITLFEKYEEQLEKYQGNLRRAAVELAKDWRADRVLRRLEALLVVGDTASLLVVSGSGELIEPDDGVIAIGSGGPYALAAARALHRFTGMEAGEIARSAMQVAAEICVYTNDKIVLEIL
ncbi:MAG: ATP-dependent protease subunit HslV [Dethiobacter sp.]|jgi:ATP-dependent HslUV protease subunit HslV|nr:ATP-dependent protease subunit HslV [Dethiobacter sp.]MBS3897914.1 ATP-dependent protease subunit HslV [Dethiobacter sp.]MBS3983176.1 ATP-dependent protease subunit HslV [Dethiobacter sp.]MCL4462985.1 ATP-dependent protease subunit HslV [Bacillota bacterium]MCL5993220.1 ATP-dependent protease subunit HslV [Bacillota bacterium]